LTNQGDGLEDYTEKAALYHSWQLGGFILPASAKQIGATANKIR